MDDKKMILETTEYLFGCDFFADDFDPEGKEEHLDQVNELLEKYLWKDIFDAWSKYLYEKCETPEEVINFCNLFFYYGGQDQFIPDPYKFLGYIIYKVDLDKNWDLAGDIVDSIGVSILEKSGNLSLLNDPNYQLWNDPQIQKEVDHLKALNEEKTS